jgi:hypothetical protein
MFNAGAFLFEMGRSPADAANDRYQTPRLEHNSITAVFLSTLAGK